MRTLALLLVVFVAGFAAGPGEEGSPRRPRQRRPRSFRRARARSETIKLFNGKNLDGWEGYTDLWSVKDGVIVAKNTEPLKFSTYLLTKQKFSDFRLMFAAKLVDVRDALGRCLLGPVHGRRRAKDPARTRPSTRTRATWSCSRPDWGMYDLFRRAGGINPSAEVRGVAKKVGKQHDWNDMEILAQGNRVRVAVNGQAVVDWRDPQPDRIKEGPIGLQLHSNTVPQEIHFKGLMLETFPKEDKLLTVK